ncbi:MAG: thioesterase family protein [Chloroflexi bacterium]|nr:thioesterase family protein [Chloroflexota bacterium]
MARRTLAPGLSGEVTCQVTDGLTADAMGSSNAVVFATPALVLLIERAAIAAIDGALDEGQGSVGAALDVKHLAPTPLGLSVTARAELVAVDGRRLTFQVSALDEVEQVASGTHERVIVDLSRFNARAARKAPGDG